MSNILDGSALAKKIKQRIKTQIVSSGIKPGLAVIVVGDDPASRVYVNNKKRDCVECDITSYEFVLPTEDDEESLRKLIRELNNSAGIHGILVQLPLPRWYNTNKVIAEISPSKDVDGLTSTNVSKLFSGQSGFIPCTPLGVMELLLQNEIEIAGKHCVVIGRSALVGKPMAMLLLQANATVTVAHSQTIDLAGITKQADILVVAAGVRELIIKDMVKPGAVVVDVGINRGDDGKLCGDVDYASVSKVASHITPIPGGVGPMTRAMLMSNTLQAAISIQQRS